jgi:hypothetical protein
MPSCVRAPCRTSELRVVRHPLVQTLALTLIKIARVAMTVRACLSDFPDFHRIPLHLTLYTVASHKALASRIPGAHRSGVVTPVTGPRPHFHGRLCWSTFYSLPRETYAALSLSQILDINLSYPSSVTLIIPHEVIRRLQLYLIDA